MKIIQVLLSPNGRLRRKQFWFSWFFVLMLGYGMSRAKEQSTSLLGLVIWIYLVVTTHGKRLHDLGKTAWKLVTPFLLTALSYGSSIFLVKYLWSNPDLMFSNSMNFWTLIISSLSLFPFAVWIVYALTIGIPKGNSGDNMYGPDPREEIIYSESPSA